MPFYEPDLIINDPNEAANNATKLSNALDYYAGVQSGYPKGLILLLPKGKIYTNTINLTDDHRGLVIQGSGTETTLINKNESVLLKAATLRYGYSDPIQYQVNGNSFT